MIEVIVGAIFLYFILQTICVFYSLVKIVFSIVKENIKKESPKMSTEDLHTYEVFYTADVTYSTPVWKESWGFGYPDSVKQTKNTMNSVIVHAVDAEHAEFKALSHKELKGSNVKIQKIFKAPS